MSPWIRFCVLLLILLCQPRIGTARTLTWFFLEPGGPGSPEEAVSVLEPLAQALSTPTLQVKLSYLNETSKLAREIANPKADWWLLPAFANLAKPESSDVLAKVYTASSSPNGEPLFRISPSKQTHTTEVILSREWSKEGLESVYLAWPELRNPSLRLLSTRQVLWTLKKWGDNPPPATMILLGHEANQLKASGLPWLAQLRIEESTNLLPLAELIAVKGKARLEDEEKIILQKLASPEALLRAHLEAMRIQSIGP